MISQQPGALAMLYKAVAQVGLYSIGEADSQSVHSQEGFNTKKCFTLPSMCDWQQTEGEERGLIFI